MAKGMVRANKFGLMDLYMRVTGKTMWPPVRVVSYTPMAIFTRASGRPIKPMVM